MSDFAPAGKRFWGKGYTSSIPLAPFNTVLPVVSGGSSPAPRVGETLSTTNGTWLHSPTSYTYQWFSVDPLLNDGEQVTFNGTPIYVGAKTLLGTAATQLIGLTEMGRLIGCDVTATNAAGSRTAESEVVGIVINDVFLIAQAINAAPTTSVYTFADLAIGTAYAARKVVIAFTTNGGTACTHTGVTANAGAITFTKLCESSVAANTNMASMWIAAVPSGTTLTAPKLTVSADSARADMQSWAHGRSATPHHAPAGVNGNAVLELTINVNHPANGLTIAHCSSTNTTGTCTWDPAGAAITEDYDSLSSSTLVKSGGRYNGIAAASAREYNPTWTLSGNVRLVAVSFGAQT